jgi:4-hydroxybenzoate polyprenyltransferase
VVRLVHPFPSFLDAAVAACVASVAGAALPRALLLGLAMLFLQFAIGAANDWADAPTDSRAQPGKPIPSGVVTRAQAAGVAVAVGAVGLALAAAVGWAPLGLAAAGLAVGLAYDLRLKRSPWSWVAYAAGIPLLLGFGWVGSGQPMAGHAVVVLAIAAVAGAALSVANALADIERDRLAGVATIATELGVIRARRLGAILTGMTLVASVITATLLGARGPGALVALGGVLVSIIGVALGWQHSGLARRRAWEVQAVGLALLAAGWLATVAAASQPG